MQEPKVTEHTNVHVDKSLENNVIIKTSVNVYRSNPKPNENISKKHQIMLLEKDSAETEKDGASNAHQENKDILIAELKSTEKGSDNLKNAAGNSKNFNGVQNEASNSDEKKSLEHNEESALEKKENLTNGSIQGNGDSTTKIEQEAENVNISVEQEAKAEKSTPASEKIKEVGNVRIERHKVHVMEHNLVVSGISVSEKKERTTVSAEDIHGNEIADGKPIKTIIVHTRAIGDRKYSMKETQDTDGKAIDSNVVTEMSDMEIKKFEEDWKDYWIPTITDEQIESGEFEKGLKELEDKKITENITIQQSEEQEKLESIENETLADSLHADSLHADSLHADSLHVDSLHAASQKYKEVVQVDQAFEAQIDESLDMEEIEETVIESFVKEHPLQVFYFGMSMLVIALMVFQCCFLPEYPPCSWFKCILECIEEANVTYNPDS